MVGTATSGGMEEWRSNWRVMLPCLAGVVLASAHGYSLGVMILPIEQEMGWSRAQISGGLFILSMVALFASPIAGRAVDRIGARRIALVGVVFFCSALALLSTAGDSVLSWWALWALLAVSNMMVMPAIWLAVINGYFLRSRGLAMAVALAGTGVGGAIFPILTDTLVNAVGWRLAYVALAGFSFVIVYPLVIFLFKPAQQELKARKAAREANEAGTRADYREQIATAKFAKLAGAAIIFAIAVSALTTNLVPILIEEGLDPTRAAAAAILLGVGSITGRLLGGYLLDRLNGNKIAAVSVLLPLIPIAIFLTTQGSLGWALFACLILGLSIGTEVDCCAYLAARHFGTRNFGTLFGTINGLLLFGNGLAPVIANYGYDLMRSYDEVMMILVPLYLLASILFLSLGRNPDLDESAEV